jgi:uncharacterized protein
MLELRPNCEYCDVDLPPASTAARICAYECTYCASHVGDVLHNVCPNCGGGFVPRPIWPNTAQRDGVGLAHQPASTERVHLSLPRDEVARFVESVEGIAPNDR